MTQLTIYQKDEWVAAIDETTGEIHLPVITISKLAQKKCSEIREYIQQYLLNMQDFYPKYIDHNVMVIPDMMVVDILADLNPKLLLDVMNCGGLRKYLYSLVDYT